MVLASEGFLEISIESRRDWDLNPRRLNSIHTLYLTELSGHEFNSLSEPILSRYSNFISLFSVQVSFPSLSSSGVTFA